LLSRAATLNGSSRPEESQSLLAQLLELAKPLSPLFDGSEANARFQLQLAFKRGTSDFVGVKPSPHGLDFLPDWKPEEALAA
jgi:hypothetical protein